MNDEDGFGFGSDHLFDAVRIEIVSSEINIAEDRSGPGIRDCVGSSDKRKRANRRLWGSSQHLRSRLTD